MKWLAYLSVLWAGAATANALVPIDYNNPPPADWPQLLEHIVPVEPKLIHGKCRVPELINREVRGCSIIAFNARVCLIYLADNDPVTLEHERAHCRGYDHVGGRNTMVEAWEKHKASKQ